MTDKEIREALAEKIERNMQTYERRLFSWDQGVLVGRANEIAAAGLCYNELIGNEYPAEDLEYLLRFEEPLMVIRDQWLAEQNVDHSEAFAHALWSVRDSRAAEEDYELDSAYVQQHRAPKTVRELLTRNPDSNFDLLTPSGYVYLTPEQAKGLLQGKSVRGNPGCSDCDREITAGELLGQKILSCVCRDDVWCAMTDYPVQRQTQQMGGMKLC